MTFPLGVIITLIGEDIRFRSRNPLGALDHLSDGREAEVDDDTHVGRCEPGDVKGFRFGITE